MEGRYLYKREVINKLLNTYKEHGNLIVAYDYDDTVHATDKKDSTFLVKAVLLQCQELGFTTILWTCRENYDLKEAVEYCNSVGLYPTYINENPEIESCQGRKPYYNILLDDKSGLDSTVEVLSEVIKIINSNRK